MTNASNWVDAVLQAGGTGDAGRAEVRRAVRALKAIGDRLLTVDDPGPGMERVAGALEEVHDRLAAMTSSGGKAERSVSITAERNPHVGVHNYLAPPVRFRPRDEAGVLRATVRYGLCHEGPPGCAHGGQIAAFFDELLLSCLTLDGTGGVTAELTVRYRRPVPLDVELEGAARMDRHEGRKRYVKGELRAPDGTLLAEAEALTLPLPGSVPTG